MWWKGNLLAHLVGMQTGAATVESSMEITQKIRNESAFRPSNFTSGNLSEETQNTHLKEPLCTPMFMAALFTVAKIWKQPKCPSVDEWIKQLWDIYKMKYYSAIKKKKNFTLCNSMDGPEECYAKWNRPVRGRQIPYDFTHVWNHEQTELISKIETDW